LKPPPVLWHEDSGRRPHDNNNSRPYDNNNRRPYDNKNRRPYDNNNSRRPYDNNNRRPYDNNRYDSTFSFILSFIADTFIVLTYFYGSGKTQQELHMSDISGMLPIDWFQTA
jgi:hypothetical protein